MFEEVYSVPEISKILKTTEQHVYRLLQAGEIRGSKIGGLWRVKESEIARVLGSCDDKRPEHE